MHQCITSLVKEVLSAPCATPTMVEMNRTAFLHSSNWVHFGTGLGRHLGEPHPHHSPEGKDNQFPKPLSRDHNCSGSFPMAQLSSNQSAGWETWFDLVYRHLLPGLHGKVELTQTMKWGPRSGVPAAFQGGHGGHGWRDTTCSAGSSGHSLSCTRYLPRLARYLLTEIGREPFYKCLVNGRVDTG